MQRIANLCLALVLLAGTALAAPFQAGKDYTVLPTAQPTGDGVEVLEFFSYLCPHCYSFRPLMHDWLDGKAPEGVDFSRVPVVFRDSWRPFAQAYYAAEVLGVLDKIHKPLFDAIHAQRKEFKSLDDIADFFAQQGVAREEALKALNSFAVDMKVRQSGQALRSYRIDSTPTVVVAGRYVVTPRSAGGHERMIEIIDALVRQELAQRK